MAVIVLAILSVAGNVAVIWVVRQNQPNGDESLLVTGRLDGVEAQLVRLQTAVKDSGAAIPVVERTLTDLEKILASIKEELEYKTGDDDTEVLNKLVAMETSIGERVAASRPDLSGIEDRLTALETALAAVSDELELASSSPGYDDTEVLNKLVAMETSIGERVAASRPDLSGLKIN